MTKKSLAIGFSDIGRPTLSIGIDENTIQFDNPRVNDTFYVGYENKRGKYSIYFKIKKIYDDYNKKTATIGVRVEDYSTSKKIKEYSLNLSTEWHTFDEL